jgi:purine nucleosidase
VALALADEPALPSLLRGFAIMGGAFGRGGNVTPAAEANIWVDPDAAHAVFRGWAGAPEAQLPIAVGLDVTELVKMDRPDVDAVTAPAPHSPLARFLQDAVPFYIEFYERSGKPGGASMHDPLALAVAIDPSLARLEATRIEVELDGRWTTGMTVSDLRGIRKTRWPAGWESTENARVAMNVDAVAFMDLFLGRLTELVRSRA